MRRFIQYLIFCVLSVGNVQANDRILNFRLQYLPNHIERHFAVVSPATKPAEHSLLQNSQEIASAYQAIHEDPMNIALLVSRGGSLQFEKYNHGASRKTPLFVYSVTKSFVAMMLLERLCEAGISNLDQPMGVHSERLRGTFYEDVTIRNALNMQSGWGKTFFKTTQIPMFQSFMRREKTRLDWIKEMGAGEAKQGAHFWYNANDTNALSILLEDLNGRSLVANFKSLFTDKIKLEEPVYWLKTGDEQHNGAASLMASARDLIALAGVFQQKLTQSQCVRDLFAQIHDNNASNGKYGYQTWLFDSAKDRTLPRRFAMMGNGGQYIAFDLDHDQITFVYSIQPKYKQGEIARLLFK